MSKIILNNNNKILTNDTNNTNNTNNDPSVVNNVLRLTYLGHGEFQHPGLNNTSVYNNTTYKSRIEKSIKDCTTILSDIIISPPTNHIIFECEIKTYSSEDMDDNIIAYTSWLSKEIYINIDIINQLETEWGINNIILNGNKYDILSIVLLHEISHDLGFVDIYGTNDNIISQSQNYQSYWIWEGENAKREYINIISQLPSSEEYDIPNSNDINNIKGVIIENDGGGHWEESEEGNIYLNNTYYPNIINDLMSPKLNETTVITKIYGGYLQDLGYTINYDSQYFNNDINNLVINSRSPTTTNNPTQIRTLKSIKYKCNCCNN